MSGGGAPASTSASSARAAALNTALTDAAATSRPWAGVRWALGRLRHFGGVDGTATFHNKTGFHTLSFERGIIQSVSGSDVVIKAADGTTWTWHVVSDTVVGRTAPRPRRAHYGPAKPYLPEGRWSGPGCPPYHRQVFGPCWVRFG